MIPSPGTRPPQVGDLVRYLDDGNTRHCYIDAVAEVLEVTGTGGGRHDMIVRLLESPNRRDDMGMYEDGSTFEDYERVSEIDGRVRNARFEVITGFAPATPVTSPAEAAAFLEQTLAKMGKA